MKKRLLITIACILLMSVLCACGSDGATIALSDTISMSGTGMSISVPEDWEAYEKQMTDEFWVMSLHDYDTGFADIYFTDYNEYDYSAKLALEDLEKYYGDAVIGDAEKLEINGMEAYRLQQSMVDLGEDGEEYNFHGYEYLIEIPGGLMEVDIYYSQSKLEAKVFKPLDSELELLRRIAESVEEN